MYKKVSVLLSYSDSQPIEHALESFLLLKKTFNKLDVFEEI